MNLKETINLPRMRKTLGAVAAVVVLWAVAGFLVLPHFLRAVVERKLAEQLHRPVTVRRLSLNPFALSATLEGVDVKERGGGAGPFFSLERLYMNLEAISLLRGGPVIRAITMTRPSVTLVRNEDGTYNFQDLLDEASKPKPAGKPLRFSLGNIRVEGGSLDFDDRPMRTKHSVRDVKIGLPFLSNIPSKVEITTLPVFEAKVNGAPFALHGRAKPFSQTRETTLDVELSDVDLPHYLSYVPTSIPSKLRAGRLDANLTVAFIQPAQGTLALVVSGTSALRKLTVENGSKPLVTCDRFEVVLDSFDVFGRKVRVKSLKAVGPEVWVRRERTGGFNVEAALAATAPGDGKKTSAQVPKARERAGPAWLVEVAAMGIEGGKIHYDDLALDRPFQALFGDVAASVKGFSTAPGQVAALEASAKSDAGETIKNAGTLSTEPLALDGALEIGGAPLKRYTPFFDRLVKFVVDDGVLDLATRYRFSTGPKANTSLSELAATLTSPRLRKRGEKKPFFQAPSVKLTSSSIDLGKHDMALGEL